MAVLLVFQGGHSYILLTGNLDDVHTIAKQMAASPVASQLSRFLRRASNIFNQQLRTGHDDNNRRSLRSQHQSTELSYEPLQENLIERRNRQDQQPHRRHRHNGTDDDPHHSYRRFEESQNLTKSYNEDQDLKNHESQESIDKSRPEERETRDNLKEEDEAQGEDNKYKQRPHERSGELEDRRQESHQSEKLDDHYNLEIRDDNDKILSPEKRDNDDIKVVRHEKSEIDSRNHLDEVVTLGKNASFYLNSIKKIMETV